MTDVALSGRYGHLYTGLNYATEALSISEWELQITQDVMEMPYDQSKWKYFWPSTVSWAGSASGWYRTSNAGQRLLLGNMFSTNAGYEYDEDMGKNVYLLPDDDEEMPQSVRDYLKGIPAMFVIDDGTFGDNVAYDYRGRIIITAATIGTPANGKVKFDIEFQGTDKLDYYVDGVLTAFEASGQY